MLFDAFFSEAYRRFAIALGFPEEIKANQLVKLTSLAGVTFPVKLADFSAESATVAEVLKLLPLIESWQQSRKKRLCLSCGEINSRDGELNHHAQIGDLIIVSREIKSPLDNAQIKLLLEQGFTSVLLETASGQMRRALSELLEELDDLGGDLTLQNCRLITDAFKYSTDTFARLEQVIAYADLETSIHIADRKLPNVGKHHCSNCQADFCGEALEHSLNSCGLTFSQLFFVFQDHQIYSLLEELDLVELQIGSRLGKLSADQKQRLKIVCAALHAPQGATWVLDYPSAYLSKAQTGKLIEFLKKFIKRGDTILVEDCNPTLIQAADYELKLDPELDRESDFQAEATAVFDVAKINPEIVPAALNYFSAENGLSEIREFFQELQQNSNVFGFKSASYLLHESYRLNRDLLSLLGCFDYLSRPLAQSQQARVLGLTEKQILQGLKKHDIKILGLEWRGVTMGELFNRSIGEFLEHFSFLAALREMRERLLQLKLVNLPATGRPVSEFSSGEKRKIILIRELYEHRPENHLYLIELPYLYADQLSRNAMNLVFKRVCKAGGTVLIGVIA